jgi:streptogramin lyase
MPQDPDFIDFLNDGRHIYSLKRAEPWTTMEAYIYVDRSAKFRLLPEPVLCIEMGTLTPAEKQFLEDYLSPARPSETSRPTRPIFRQIFERVDRFLWFVYEDEYEREDEAARLHTRDPKDVRLRKPGTWGIPDALTLRRAGIVPEHQDLTRSGFSLREHRFQAKRTYRGDIMDPTGMGHIPGIESSPPPQPLNSDEPMIQYVITGEDRWRGSPLPEPGNPFSPKNHPIFNQDGQRYINEIVNNEKTYWSKIPSNNPGSYGNFEVTGWVSGDALTDKANVRMAGMGAKWSEDGSQLFGFLDDGEILVNDSAGKPLGGIRGTSQDVMPPPPIYIPVKAVQTAQASSDGSQPGVQSTFSLSKMLLGLVLVGLVVMVLAGGIVWFTFPHASPVVRVHHTSPILRATEFPLPTSISSPTVITAGPDGNLWFTDWNGDKIGRITPNGTITEFPISSLNKPRDIFTNRPLGAGPLGITAGPNGNLWFTEYGVDMIGRITPNGTITEFPIPSPSGQPMWITAGPDGNLWFTEHEYNGDSIRRITLNGMFTEFPLPTPNSGPTEITAGPDGNLWFTEHNDIGNKIGRITPNGTITEFPLPTSRSRPTGITAGPDGDLWFTESNNHRIGRITPNGRITEFPIPSHTNPMEITAGPDGNLWFTEYNANRIGRISPSGTITEFLTSPSLDSILQAITAGPDGNLWFTGMGYTGFKIGRISLGK